MLEMSHILAQIRVNDMQITAKYVRLRHNRAQEISGF